MNYYSQELKGPKTIDKRAKKILSFSHGLKDSNKDFSSSKSKFIDIISNILL